MNHLKKMLLALFLFATSMSALAEIVAYVQVPFDPTVDSPTLRMTLINQAGNYVLQPDKTIRLVRSETAQYGDWTRREFDGNMSTVDGFEHTGAGTFVVTSGGGGGAGGSWNWVTVVWNEEWSTTCSVGSQTISCSGETEFP